MILFLYILLGIFIVCGLLNVYAESSAKKYQKEQKQKDNKEVDSEDFVNAEYEEEYSDEENLIRFAEGECDEKA